MIDRHKRAILLMMQVFSFIGLVQIRDSTQLKDTSMQFF